MEQFYSNFYIPEKWHLIVHIYSSWLPITVANNNMRHFSSEDNINMANVSVILNSA